MTHTPRRMMRLNLVDGPAVPEEILATPDARPPTEEDREALAVLLANACDRSGNGAGADLDTARREIDLLMDGDRGDWQPEISEVVDHGGVLSAATLVTRWKGAPLVAFSMTLPAFRRQGLARAGLLRTARRLWESGEPELTLRVDRGDVPAESFCKSLGFIEEDPPGD